MYITQNTEQTTRQYTAVLTQPSIDESQIELFDSYDPVLHLKLATPLITDYLSLFPSIVTKPVKRFYTSAEISNTYLLYLKFHDLHISTSNNGPTHLIKHSHPHQSRRLGAMVYQSLSSRERRDLAFHRPGTARETSSRTSYKAYHCGYQWRSPTEGIRKQQEVLRF